MSPEHREVVLHFLHFWPMLLKGTLETKEMKLLSEEELMK